MFHRRRMQAPINSEKHYVQVPSFSVAANGVANQDLVRAVQVLNKNATHEVEEGSIVKAVYVEFWFTEDAAAQGFGVFTVMKLPAGAVVPTNSNLQNLASYVNKKNVFFTFEGLLPPNTQNPVPVIRQWIKIPKGKQRMGLDDRILVTFAADGVGLTACGFSVYKEYK